jgi:hypothetical protein
MSEVQVTNDDHEVEGEDIEEEEEQGEIEGEDPEEDEDDENKAEKETNDEENVQNEIEISTKQTDGKKSDNEVDKKSLIDSLGFTRSLSASKVKEIIGLGDQGTGLNSMLKMFTPSVLTGEPQPQQFIVSTRMKELKDSNDEARKILVTKYSTLLKGINREVVGLNVPLTRTLSIAQDISYYIRSLNEDLQTLTNQISEMDLGPLLSVKH